jgi:hypothetical protein
LGALGWLYEFWNEDLKKHSELRRGMLAGTGLV